MRRPGYTIIVQKDGALTSRQWHLKGWVARTLAGLGIAVLVIGVLLAVLYGPIVGAAARLPLVEREAEQLREENARVNELARQLDDAEARYAHLRGMLGGGVAIPELRADSGTRVDGGSVYVAPPIVARAPQTDTVGEPEGPSIPRRWPLAVASFRTRGLASGDPNVESHAGLDLAVPVGADVRAAGGGLVRRTGTDSSYGEYVLLAHPEGYETMYGHLSRVLVTNGEAVRAGQVIALSGNTGRSTAPHLHFEVRRYGRSVDPLTVVQEGR